MPRLLPEDTVLNIPPDASEHIHQREFVSWFRKNYPDDTLFAIPSGGKRGAATAARLKLEGVIAGVPDLFWLKRACWIEMKKPGGRLSKSQKQFIARAMAAGYQVIVAYGFDEAVRKVLELDDRPVTIFPVP